MFVKSKFKNKIFAVIPHSESPISGGVSMIPLYHSDSNVSGIQLQVDGNKNFIMHEDDFTHLLDMGFIEEVELDDNKARIPNDVRTVFRKQYKKNNKE